MTTLWSWLSRLMPATVYLTGSSGNFYNCQEYKSSAGTSSRATGTSSQATGTKVIYFVL
jgi:hypothetical protein